MGNDQTKRCATCGAVLRPTVSGKERLQCPLCSPLPGALAICRDEKIGFSGHVMGEAVRDGQPVGFTESERRDLTRYAALQEDGTILLNLAGIPPRGEQDSENVARVLLDRFCSVCEDWVLRGRGTGDDDILVKRISPSPCIDLSVQVVQALISKSFWEELFCQKQISRRLSIPEISTALRAAIQHKSLIPPGHRSKMILALNASRVPAFAVGDVAKRFCQVEGLWAASLGFYSIFVVGPTKTWVHRLDDA
jgi:hypothetical protein